MMETVVCVTSTKPHITRTDAYKRDKTNFIGNARNVGGDKRAANSFRYRIIIR